MRFIYGQYGYNGTMIRQMEVSEVEQCLQRGRFNDFPNCIIYLFTNKMLNLHETDCYSWKSIQIALNLIKNLSKREIMAKFHCGNLEALNAKLFYMKELKGGKK
jgi:hypothetical protein